MSNEIINSLRNKPEDWFQSRHCLHHIPSGIEIWTSNGFFGINYYPSGVISLRHKYNLWRAVRHWGESRAL